MQKHVIGIDVGYGHTKVVTDTTGGMIVPVLFPSAVGTFECGTVIDGLKAPEKDVVSFDGQRFLVGASAIKHSGRLLESREKNWIGSPAYKALFLNALRLTECNSIHLVIVTGLPVGFYGTDKDKLAHLVREIAQGYCVDLTVRVIPQPLGSFFDRLLDESGKVKDNSLVTGRIGVVDIGYYTTDLLMVSDLEFVERQADSCENGVSTALELIAKDIEQIHGMRPDIHATEQAIKQGWIKVFGERKGIFQIADRRLGEIAREIEAKVHIVWKAGSDIDQVLLTGGGAALLKGHLNLYKHAVVTVGAQVANARGYFKFGRLSQ